MKLSIIGPVYPFRGGIAHYTALMSRSFETRGHQIQTISFLRQYPSWLYPGKSDKDPSQDHLEVNAVYWLDPLLPWTWFSTIQKIRGFQPDVVIIQWWTTFWAIPFFWITWVLRKAGIPVIYLIHNVLPHEEKAMDKWLVRFALRPAHAYIVQTQREKERLEGLVRGRMISLCKLPNYSFFKAEVVDKDAARKRIGIETKGFLLLFFGLVRPYKGLDQLLEAMAMLQKKDAFPHLLIAGEYWGDVSKLKSRVHMLMLDQQVHLDNRYIPDEEVGICFSASDCLVAPYTGGTQSAAATIAISFGLPMIISERVAQGIELEKQKNILSIVPAGDVTALADAIFQAMNRKPLPLEPVNNPSDDWQCLIDVIHQSLQHEKN